MGKIIMLHGFRDGKPHHLEVRMSLYHGEVILRFRDDCRRFDIREKAAQWKAIRGCKILKYNNSLKTNNLLVVL